ncbi:helix-turn-helix domain-containing protein [Spirillospora sp. NPDC052269]
MPKLWDETIDAHRSAVRDAALDATAALVAEHGLVMLTMSQIAERAGIGRATLYKYFPDVQAVLSAWHERQVNAHLRQVDEVADPNLPPGARLEAALLAYALTPQGAHGRHDDGLAVLLHGGEHVQQALHRLHAFFRDLIDEAARADEVRDDMDPGQLATYCLHALTAARGTSDQAAVQLVSLTMSALRPQAPPA